MPPMVHLEAALQRKPLEFLIPNVMDGVVTRIFFAAVVDS
jgi:hypothetical protein